MNARWHRQHPTPKPASLYQRMRWHVAHAAACGCRSMPRSIVGVMPRRGNAGKTGVRTRGNS